MEQKIKLRTREYGDNREYILNEFFFFFFFFNGRISREMSKKTRKVINSTVMQKMNQLTKIKVPI